MVQGILITAWLGDEPKEFEDGVSNERGCTCSMAVGEPEPKPWIPVAWSIIGKTK